jgi:citrate lyase subunit beta/citryl-CoA lyase
LTAPFQLARTLTLVGARAAGVAPVDTVFASIGDEAGLRAECEAARQDGFTCKLAIHPAQVPVINACFMPSKEAIAKAQAIVSAFATGAGVVSVDGVMMARPHLLLAQRILARASGALR